MNNTTYSYFHSQQLDYRIEYNGNPEFITLHVNQRLVHDSIDDPKVQYWKNELKNVAGVNTIFCVYPYSVTIDYAKTFRPETVLSAVVFCVARLLNLPVGDALRPPIKPVSR